jgi:hypothetical protein
VFSEAFFYCIRLSAYNLLKAFKTAEGGTPLCGLFGRFGRLWRRHTEKMMPEFETGIVAENYFDAILFFCIIAFPS